MVSFLAMVILTAKSIVHEKETGLRESMRLMGMKTYIYWLSWYIKTFALVLPSIVVIVVVFKIKLTTMEGGDRAIVEFSDTVLFALFLLLYVSSSITFTFMCTAFFKKANNAAAGAGIVWFLSFLPCVFVTVKFQSISLFTKTAIMLIVNLAMGEGIIFFVIRTVSNYFGNLNYLFILISIKCLPC